MKKLSKSEKQSRKRKAKAAKIERWKCSGKKSCHGMRSAVAMTWDERKATKSAAAVKTVSAKSVPADRLDAMAKRIADAQGWSYEWVRAKTSAQIFGMARKYL
jgi:hypothetical protein